MSILIRSLEFTELPDYSGCYTSCIILTNNNRLLLQQRGKDWANFPGLISTFGGKVESGERPVQAIVRELEEELGAMVLAQTLVFLGAYTEKMTGWQDVIFGYFWHDVDGKIIGCYEGEPVFFEAVSNVLQCPILTDDVKWLLNLCQQKRLLA